MRTGYMMLGRYLVVPCLARVKVGGSWATRASQTNCDHRH